MTFRLFPFLSVLCHFSSFCGLSRTPRGLEVPELGTVCLDSPQVLQGGAVVMIRGLRPMDRGVSARYL